jgi:fatty-acyl-CoA synthase
LTQGYQGNPEASEALWAHGWLHTQDLAERDPDGAIRIVDRLKDVIKTGGEWVSSAALEACAMAHPFVAEAAFIAVPNDRWGERPVGVIVPRNPEQTVTLEMIQTHLAPYIESGSLSRYALPDAIIALPSLPKTSVGKVNKKALRQVIAQRDMVPRTST